MTTQFLYNWASTTFTIMGLKSDSEVLHYTSTRKGFYVTLCVCVKKIWFIGVAAGVLLLYLCYTWTPNFQMHEDILCFFLVWVTLKNLYIWLNSCVENIAPTLGQGSFVQRVSQSATSRTWCKGLCLMKNGAIWDLQAKMWFAWFPNVWYKSHTIGRFAREFPLHLSWKKTLEGAYEHHIDWGTHMRGGEFKDAYPRKELKETHL